MRKQRRLWQEASISFLDVISCGFGAVILLLIIVRIGDPAMLEEAENQLLNSVKASQKQLFEIRSESALLNEQLRSRTQQLSDFKQRIARLKQQLASLNQQSTKLSLSQEKQQLQLALQVLTEEMERLLGSEFQQQNQLIGGIPADSEYIIFVIDTSGSMQVAAWEKVKKEMLNILDIYPQVKGIQVLNDMGKYMFPSYREQWIPDSTEMRNKIINTLTHWAPFSNSSPVEGIDAAIKTFYRPNLKISIYTLGDDFQGRSIRSVVKAVGSLNKAHRGSNRLVRIHGIGFPVHFPSEGTPNSTAIKFAALMRELSYNNGGTFIGLNSL